MKKNKNKLRRVQICALSLILSTNIVIMCNLMNITQQDKKIINGLKISYDSLNEDNNQIKEVNANYERQLNELKQDKTTKYCDNAQQEMELIKPFEDSDKENYIKAYLDIVNKYSKYVDTPESLEDYYTDAQIQIMLKCIETETFEAPFDAKVNVASVILNRLNRDEFPTDPIKLITDKNQFAYGRNNITEETKYALYYAWYIKDTTDGAIGFRSDCSPSKWNGWYYSSTDGYHYFYRLEGTNE